MTDRWVPTGREFDEGTQSPLGPGKASRRSRLLDRVLGRTRRVRPEIAVRPGVGEARVVFQAPPSMPESAQGTAASPVPTIGAPSTPAEPPPHTYAAIEPTAPHRRSRRRTTVRRGIAPDIGPRPERSDDGPVGSWPKDLTEAEICRLIGPTQNYDDAT
jgi:hypothetical protein